MRRLGMAPIPKETQKEPIPKAVPRKSQQSCYLKAKLLDVRRVSLQAPCNTLHHVVDPGMKVDGLRPLETRERKAGTHP